MDMRDKLKKLVEERAELWEGTMKPLVMKDEMDVDDRSTYANAEERLDQVDKDIVTVEAALARDAAEGEAAEKRAELLAVAGEQINEEEQLTNEERYDAAFWNYIKNGTKRTSADDMNLLESHLRENRALTTGTGSSGGFLIPEGFWRDIQEAQLAFGGLRNAGVTNISTADGGDLPVPTGTDTGNVGELVSENAAVNEQDTTFGQVTLGAYLWSSKMIRVPLTLIQDSAFDLPSYLSARLGERIGRAQAPYWITGTGTGQPEGIVTGTTVGHTTTGGQTTTLIYDDFVELEHSIDPAYRKQSEYVLSDSALKAARLIKDGNGLPLWAPGIASGGMVAPTINGFGYTVDQSMATVAASNKPILFGDVSAYWIRDVLGLEMVRLDERYADYRQVAFLAWSRSDGRQVDAGDDRFKVLAMAAS